jgi:hypothetical protein
MVWYGMVWYGMRLEQEEKGSRSRGVGYHCSWFGILDLRGHGLLDDSSGHHTHNCNLQYVQVQLPQSSFLSVFRYSADADHSCLLCRFFLKL